MPKILAQYRVRREYRQYRVHCFGVMMPMLWDIGPLSGEFGRSMKPLRQPEAARGV